MFAALEQRILAPINRLVRKALVGFILAFLAVIFLLLSLGFVSFAAYNLLTDSQSPAIAAAIVGGALSAVAIILVVIALIVMRTKSRDSTRSHEELARNNFPPPLALRTGYPMIDLAQIVLPLVLPLRKQAQNRINEKPVSSVLITLATGVIAGFYLLTRRPFPSRERKKKS